MKTPLVSVIVPNYNYADYLPLRIRSVLNQSFRDMEVILLDDASSDHSMEVLQRYQQEDPRVSAVVRNEQNSGSPFRQWKKGMELARGTYIWIAESDDYADCSFLRKTVSLLEQYPAAAYCFTGSYVVDESGHVLDKDMDCWTKQQQQNPMGYKVFPGKDYVARNLYWMNYVYNASGVLFRKQAFQLLTDDQWASMRYCGDWRFWIFMALQGDVIELYERLNYFRKHPDSVTVDSKQSDGAYAACMRECMAVTCAVEDSLSLCLYKRMLTYGGYYKDFKRQPVGDDVRQELLQELRRRYPAVRLAYWVERLNKTLSGLLPCLKRMQAERCR